MAIFGHSKFIPVFLGKIVRKNSKWPFLAIPNFWKKLSEKFGMAIFGHSEFIPVFLEKLSEKIWNGHFWLFQIDTSLFGKSCHKKFVMAIPNFSDNFSVHITLLECNGLESNEICTFLDFYSEI